MSEELPATAPSADFPFESRFISVHGHRIHYVEEGVGDPVLFIHGNPTWSYVWRNVLSPVSRGTGTRAIALDFLGFGRSDKPRLPYSAELHYRTVEGFIEELALSDLTLVLHDWGGPLGTMFAVRHPGSVRAVALMESFLWTLTWEDFGTYRRTFKVLRSPAGYVMIQVLNMMVKKLMPATCPIGPQALHRFLEPFPTVRSRRAMRAFPRLIPIEGKPAAETAFIEELEEGMSSLTFPMLWIKATPGLVVTDRNPSTLRHLTALRDRLPQLEVVEFGPGHHFLQEDDPAKLSAILVKWMQQTQRPETGGLGG